MKQYNITGANGNIHFTNVAFSEEGRDDYVEKIKGYGNRVVSITVTEPDLLISYHSDGFTSMNMDGLIRLGPLPDIYGSGGSPYYCVPSRENEARTEFGIRHKAKTKQVDAYYAQPWV